MQQSRFLKAASGLALAALTVAALFAAACGDDDSSVNAAVPTPADQRNQQLIDSFTPPAGATLVREWALDAGNETSLVREYATSLPLPEAPTTVIGSYKNPIVAQGWQEQPARGSMAGFTRGADRIIVGAVGPDMMEAPPMARILKSANAPAGSAFYFTIEVVDR